jgi:hypothetical protein
MQSSLKGIRERLAGIASGIDLVLKCAPHPEEGDELGEVSKAHRDAVAGCGGPARRLEVMPVRGGRMTLDALMLSRIQFGFTIAFHIIFPAFTIGLASWLARLEFEWLRTGNYLYKNLYKFWVKVFAVSFGLGVVSGIVMSYQLGTNWSRYSEFVGNVIGPVIAYEVITAFCLEAGFLGIMLFGWNRVGDRLHFFSTCMVALGTLISAFWILSANSWMQTPAGFRIENGIALPTDWWQIIFNPSFPIRYVHMVLGCFLTTAFAVGACRPGCCCAIRTTRPRPSSRARGSRSPWRCGSRPSWCPSRSSSATCTGSASSSTSRRSSPRSKGIGSGRATCRSASSPFPTRRTRRTITRSRSRRSGAGSSPTISRAWCRA